MHQIGRIWLARVNSRGEDYGATESYFFRTTQKVSNNHHLAVVSRQSLRKHSLSDFILCFVNAESSEQFTAVWVCVRIAMGQIDFIVVVFEGDLKWKSVIWAASFALHRVLVITNIVAVAVPANAARTCSFFCRVEKRLLSLIVTRIWLYQIDDVEFITYIFAGVWNFEVVPLSVGCRPVIILENQIISVFADTQGPP